MTGGDLAVDQRSVGELLLDADLTARASLWDPNPDSARARVRAWGEVLEAAADLWSSIPDAAHDPSMRRIEVLAQGVHRRHLRTGWPGAGPADPHLESVASSLSRAAELVQGRRHPTAPLSREGHLDAEVARTRLMHVLYVSTHAVAVALNHHMTDLQRRINTRKAIPAGDSLQQARDTSQRISAVERLAGAYLHGRWPTTLTGEHRDHPEPGRLQQALARWDVQTHRTLAGPPTTANLEWVARVQQSLIVTTDIIGAAGASQSRLDPHDIERTRPALAGLDRAWGALAADLSRLHGRRRSVDPDLLLAGREVHAATREITHHHAGFATPELMATRVDLAAAAGHLHQSLTATVDLAHVTRDALNDPQLTVGARGAHTLAPRPSTAAGQAAWVDAGDLNHNREIAVPQSVRDMLTSRAQHIIDSAHTADSAATSLQRPPHQQPAPEPSAARRLDERTPPKVGPGPVVRCGCER